MNIQLGITDHLDPEVQAMLAAMYSRSYAPIESRIPDSEESAQSHKEKLGRFYVGYNHRSVGQLGSTTIFIEGVSQLAEKAIQNHPLYNGQSSSTRYIDFSTQPMENFGDSRIQELQEKCRAFYVKAMPVVIERMKNDYPFHAQLTKDADDAARARLKTTWENTIKARAFDICRGWLPAGAVTNVAFTGTFDLINSHFGEMLKHPSPEMRDIAREVLKQLGEKYQYAAFSIEKLEERFAYVDPATHFYVEDDYYETHPDTSYQVCVFDESSFKTVKEASGRKKGDAFPNHVSAGVFVRWKDRIDFGSFRDLHRHRNGKIAMPLLTPYQDFPIYYVLGMNAELVSEAETLINEFTEGETFKALYAEDKVKAQYAVPMGFNVTFDYTCDINQLLYILELRSGKTVHQTARHAVLRCLEKTQAVFGDLKIHADRDVDNFTMKRGTQTVDVPQEYKEM